MFTNMFTNMLYAINARPRATYFLLKASERSCGRFFAIECPCDKNYGTAREPLATLVRTHVRKLYINVYIT